MDVEKLIAENKVRKVWDQKGRVFYIWKEHHKPPITEVTPRQYKILGAVFEGKPCKRCNNTTRLVSNKNCIICSREYRRKYRAKQREALANA